VERITTHALARPVSKFLLSKAKSSAASGDATTGSINVSFMIAENPLQADLVYCGPLGQTTHTQKEMAPL
jgi:hypothetical protein